MNKNLILIIGAVLLLLLGIGGYFMTRKNAGTPSDLVSNDSQMGDGESTTAKSDFSGTLPELLALGQNYNCTFEYADEAGNKTTGLVYVSNSGNKMSGNFQYTGVDGTTSDNNIISDGEYSYMWSSQMEQGIKTKLPEDNSTLFGSSDSSQGTKSGVSDTDKMDFDCDSWSVDESLFVPPANIEFMDFSSFSAGSNGTPGQEGPDCSVCDQIPAGSAKDQCLQSLGC